MKFLHARIHALELRALDDQGVSLDSPELLVVRCPRCRDPYFGQVTAKLGSRERALLKDRATTRLGWECPDHAHRFEV